MPREHPSEDPVTTLLQTVGLPSGRVEDRLIESAYEELRRVASFLIRGETPGQTLQATGLVNEAYLKLVNGDPVQWNDRRHFINTAARAMRQVLIDRARGRAAKKRGGGRQREEAIDIVAGGAGRLPDDEVIRLEAALEGLEATHARSAEVAHLRFFAGLTVAQVADLLGIAAPTVKKDWQFARAWLARALDPSTGTQPEAS